MLRAAHEDGDMVEGDIFGDAGGGEGALVEYEADDPGTSEAWIVGGSEAKIMTSRGDLASLAARLAELEATVEHQNRHLTQHAHQPT